MSDTGRHRWIWDLGLKSMGSLPIELAIISPYSNKHGQMSMEKMGIANLYGALS
jgi:hypothetical protein